MPTSPAMPQDHSHHTAFPIITPVLRRHLEDAAFYWAQLDGAPHIKEWGLAKYAHFNQLLDTHLEGALCAREAAWPVALGLAQRWRGAGEAFVVTRLALRWEDAAWLTQALQCAQADPERQLRGVISALAWQPDQFSLTAIVRLAHESNPPMMQVAGLRAAALQRSVVGQDLQLGHGLDVWFDSDHAPARAAACRALAAGFEGRASAQALLAQAGRDWAIEVRAEAAIASAMLGDVAAPAALWQAVQEQQTQWQAASGWSRKQAARRLARWVRHLAVLVPPGQIDLAQLGRVLSPRLALAFYLYHADPACLPLLIQAMSQPECAHLAGWVWQTITGYDLRSHGLALPHDPAQKWPGEAAHDADSGMALPHVSAILALPVMQPPAGQRYLLGQPFNLPQAYGMLDDGPQILRNMSALYLQYALRQQVNVRGPAQAQLQQLQTLAQRIGMHQEHAHG